MAQTEGWSGFGLILFRTYFNFDRKEISSEIEFKIKKKKSELEGWR
jgi:hypothetical protein